MTEKIARGIVLLFGPWAGTLVGKYVIVFLISMFPILELRGGLIAASLLDLPMWQSFLICFLGNVIPIPFVLWFIEIVFKYLRKLSFFDKIISKLERHADSKKEQIEKLKYFGLFLFVGIPLPGTGAWTGCLIAVLLGLDKKKSFISALLGVIMAGVIMLILSYGVLGNIIR